MRQTSARGRTSGRQFTGTGAGRHTGPLTRHLLEVERARREVPKLLADDPRGSLRQVVSEHGLGAGLAIVNCVTRMISEGQVTAPENWSADAARLALLGEAASLLATDPEKTLSDFWDEHGREAVKALVDDTIGAIESGKIFAPEFWDRNELDRGYARVWSRNVPPKPVSRPTSDPGYGHYSLTEDQKRVARSMADEFYQVGMQGHARGYSTVDLTSMVWWSHNTPQEYGPTVLAAGERAVEMLRRSGVRVVGHPSPGESTLPTGSTRQYLRLQIR